MANDEVRPALTAEGWNGALAGTYRIEPGDDTGRWTLVDEYLGSSNFHAAAALALYGQPFGFTRQDLTLLDYIATTLLSGDWGGEDQAGERVRALAARLAALLPPEAV